MSAQPECADCGKYINSGFVICSSCDGAKYLRQAIRDFASHQPLDLMTAKEIQAGLFALAAVGEAGK